MEGVARLGVALGRDYDLLSVNAPPVTAHDSGRDAMGASVLEYSHPQCFDNGSQASHELGRMYARHVGGEYGAAGV